MEVVERILSKVVGKELSVEEIELVGGGQNDHCVSAGGYWTGGEVAGIYCDYDMHPG
jgi:hypothetical protein